MNTIKFSGLFDNRQSADPIFDENYQIVGYTKYPNNDALYGPYNSVSIAFTALSSKVNGVDSLTQGKTVGVVENGSIVEYWFKDAIGSGANGAYTQADLVRKEPDLTEVEEAIGALEEAIGTGGSVDEKISEVVGGATSDGNTLKKIEDRVSPLESVVGNGGSIDTRIAIAKSEIIGDAASDYNTLGKLEDKIQAEASRAQAAEALKANSADVYSKTETYTKTEVHNLITTPNQEYVSVTATAQTTAVTDVLPATGAADTTYRVGNWDGTQYNDSVFSEYAWNGSAYIKLSTKSQIGEVYDISTNHADAKYADLAAALGTNGTNVPSSIRKGGMSIKYVNSYDNKYVQYRLMSDTFNTTPANWQGLDDEPTENSQNLVKSGGVESSIAAAEQRCNARFPNTEEDGFFVADENENVGMKYDEEGLDFAKISQHAIEVLKSKELGGSSNTATVQEDGFFVVDEELNIGMAVDNNGLHAKNILEYEIVEL